MYAVKSDDATKTRRSQYPGAVLQAAMMIRKPTKPISMFYALTSVNDKRPTVQADKIIKRFPGMYLQNLFIPDKADFISLKNLLPQL